MPLPKTVPAKWMRECKVGDVIICDGHTSHCKTPLQKAGFKYTTNKAWLCFASTEQPMAVTILTVTEFPEDGSWIRNI